MRDPVRRKIDVVSVINASCRNRHVLKTYVRAIADDDREGRLAVSECRLCHYSRQRVGGAMMTAWACGLCGFESSHGSTAVPYLCLECAREKRLCRLCGSDVDDKNRRKL